MSRYYSKRAVGFVTYFSLASVREQTAARGVQQTQEPPRMFGSYVLHVGCLSQHHICQTFLYSVSFYSSCLKTHLYINHSNLPK